jgi:hypothetical protein
MSRAIPVTGFVRRRGCSAATACEAIDLSWKLGFLVNRSARSGTGGYRLIEVDDDLQPGKNE